MASEAKKALLATAAALLCLAPPLGAGEATASGAQEAYTCVASYGKGLGSWETAWSDAKKDWCCKHKGLACPLMTSPPYDCQAGLANWKLGWSTSKRAWCCRHGGLGCPEEAPGDVEAAERGAGGPLAVPLGDIAIPGTANNAQLALRAAMSATCGVSGVLDERDHFRSPDSLQPVCGRSMTTNCTVSYSAMRCPSGCEYLVPNHRFACLFECVPARMCSSSNTNRPYPDPETGLCSSCHVQSCKVCDQKDTCAACHPGFDLSVDRSRCTFHLDDKLDPNTIVQIAGGLLGVIVLLAFIWNCTKGDHPKKDKNMVAIMRARRHRHLCKVADWRLGSTRKVRERYPLSVNVHKVHILGVGLPLFYNSICFLALVALLFLGATYAVYTTSGVSSALALTDRSVASLAALAVQPPSEAPAMLLSPLAVCDRRAAPNILRDVRDFATRNFYVLGLLYALTFALSLAHGKIQLYCSRRYDEVNRTMADYALRIEGLQKSLTDEDRLAKQFQEAFRSAGGPGSSGQDLRSVDVVGLSICYNYLDVWSQVDEMKDRLTVSLEVELDSKIRAEAARREKAPPAPLMDVCDEQELRRQVEGDRVRAKRWFQEGSSEKLNSTGELFVVFRMRRDVEAVWGARADVASRLQAFAESAGGVQLHQVFSEPPSINWWHLAKRSADQKVHVRRAVVYILAIIVAVQLFIILPYARCIVWPYSSTGSAAGGTKMQISGMILGNINMFVGLQIFFTSYGLGFHRKDAVDMMVLCSNTALVMVNTFFNIIVMAITVFSQSDSGFGPSILLSVDSLVAIGTEGSLAESIYHLLHPGTFFVGYIMCVVMAGVVPFIWNSILMKIIYVWRCLPDPMLRALKLFLPWAGDLSLDDYPFRNAEKGFEPMEIGISWDYSAMIVNPTVCFCMLFFVSPYVWQTFLMMFGWTCFYYFFCRYQHLRFCKACYYTTNRLDCAVNFLWGIPLSVVAAACCVWGIRSGKLVPEAALPLKYLLVAASFFASFTLWVLSYQYLLDPWLQRDTKEEASATYEEVKRETLYSWFNCNPVYVLKCAYHYSEATIEAEGVGAAAGAPGGSAARRAAAGGGSPEAEEARAAGAAGGLRVGILSARGLRDADWLPGAGSSDPYCTCEIVGKPHSKQATVPRKHESNPQWDFETQLAHYADGDSLTFTVFDKDCHKRDDCLGKVTVSGEQVRAGFSGELPLQGAGRGVKAYLKICVEAPQVGAQQTRVSIISASGLRDADWLPGAKSSDPYCICDVKGKPSMQLMTPMHDHQTKPNWNFSTGLQLEAGDSLVFTVLDKDFLKRGDCLGKATLSSDQICKGFDGELSLEGAGRSVKASLKIRVAPPGAVAEKTQADNQVGEKTQGTADAKRGARPARFYEVGKEYLFLSEQQQEFAMKDLKDNLEYETCLEYILSVCGRLANPCRAAGHRASEASARRPLAEERLPILLEQQQRQEEHKWVRPVPLASP